ncbi:hypothetical protein ElyMa_005003100 [Elysia marginata]|uniref:Uncharacterized protein n=1 Tax=Elysia marginata TaxID=1093978 RepID=A0AAV4JCE3_9GAST|nr:hypothetical protein ElyMa_005003100 [Elysia marginata]
MHHLITTNKTQHLGSRHGEEGILGGDRDFPQSCWSISSDAKGSIGFGKGSRRDCDDHCCSWVCFDISSTVIATCARALVHGNSSDARGIVSCPALARCERSRPNSCRGHQVDEAYLPY